MFMTEAQAKSGSQLYCYRKCRKKDTIFMLELLECSKRIYDIPKFVFYALGYATERVLSRTRSGIKGFLLKKKQSQQLALSQCFGLGVFG